MNEDQYIMKIFFKTIMKAKWPQSQGQEIELQFHASQVHGTSEKTRMALFKLQELHP